MSAILLAVAVVLVLALAGLYAHRIGSERRGDRVWPALARAGVGAGEREAFDPRSVEDLPGPARRYLLHALEPGTPLAGSVRLSLSGSLRLGRDRDPIPMRAEEVVAPSRGYVWKAAVRLGPLTIRGFDAYADGRGRMRWWLAGLAPVVGADGPDVSRSAAGRLLGESFPAPSALLPSRGAQWEGQDDDTARVRLQAGGETVVLTPRVGPDGSLERIGFPRWNADPRNGPVGYLPFVSESFAAERTFEGRTLPTRFRAGWRLDAQEAYPFYFVADLEAAYVPVTPPEPGRRSCSSGAGCGDRSAS